MFLLIKEIITLSVILISKDNEIILRSKILLMNLKKVLLKKITV